MLFHVKAVINGNGGQKPKINLKLEFDRQMLIKKSGEWSVIPENSDKWMRARNTCSLTHWVKMDTGKNPNFQNASSIVNVCTRITNEFSILG